MSTTVFQNNGSALYNNGRCAISKDLIFGLSVWNGTQFYPLSKLDHEDLVTVHAAIDGDPLFMWKTDFDRLMENAS